MPDIAAPTVPPIISAWQDDPGSGAAPDGGLLLDREVPPSGPTPFPTQITMAPAPAPDRYPVGSSGFRFWSAADALGRASALWGSLLPRTTPWNPAVGAVLPVILDGGEDFNAYYDRASLTFFHGTAGGRTVFSGESPDILCHEFGHAILDSIRPQLWDTASVEVGAFHESFGDMSALLSALRIEEVRATVLADTAGHLYRSSRLSRLAEQLGWAIRALDASLVEVDCLRNAVNHFFYSAPGKLPTSAPASELSSEPHSFSRVFTGAFFEALAGMFASRATQTEADLAQVAADLGGFLVTAVRQAAIVPEFFAEVGGRLQSAAAAADPAYGSAVRSALVRHGILSVEGVVSVARAPAHAMAAFSAALPLPLHQLDVSALGFTVPTIKLQVAAQPRHLSLTGAALDAGNLQPTSADHCAREFVEDLVRRGRLDPNGYAAANVTVVDPGSFKTHALVDEGGDAVLRRRRIDCIPRR